MGLDGDRVPSPADASLEGKIPLEVYFSQIEQVRTVPDPAMLDPLFLCRVKRAVKHDATFELENRLYELPAVFAGQKIELRYDEQAVHMEGKAIAVRFADNANVKRERPALSFKAIQERAGEALAASTMGYPRLVNKIATRALVKVIVTTECIRRKCMAL